VAFEVERFDWPTADRLEVVGRWFGVRGRRFIRPTLDVEVHGESRRMLAVLDHKPWAVEDGEDWIAAFAWQGEPADLTGGELSVGPDIAVELLPPGEQPATPPRRAARRPHSDALETEIAALRKETRRLSGELRAARSGHAADLDRLAAEHRAELERVRDEQTTAVRQAEHRAAALQADLDAERGRAGPLETALRDARHELAVARADVAAERKERERERVAIAAEASKAAAEEAERMSLERDAARRESANARAERDAARRESANARAERDTVLRDRDRARQDRTATLSLGEREGVKRLTVQPSDAPDEAVAETVPLAPVPAAPTWVGPSAPALPARVLAIAALIVFVLALVLLVSWAL